jgi:hypothetical protein
MYVYIILKNTFGTMYVYIIFKNTCGTIYVGICNLKNPFDTLYVLAWKIHPVCFVKKKSCATLYICVIKKSLCHPVCLARKIPVPPCMYVHMLY